MSALIRFYQRHLTQFTPRCGYAVPCSQYALENGLRAMWHRALWEPLPSHVPGTRPECVFWLVPPARWIPTD